DVIVVATTPEHGLYLQSIAHPGMIVERDHHLKHLGSFGPQIVSPFRSGTDINPLSVSPMPPGTTDMKFHVQDAVGTPLANAEVVIYPSDGGQDQESTDANGDATLSIPGGFVRDVIALYVKPAANYWERFVSRPELDQDKINVVTLRPLSEFQQAHF